MLQAKFLFLFGSKDIFRESAGVAPRPQSAGRAGSYAVKACSCERRRRGFSITRQINVMGLDRAVSRILNLGFHLSSHSLHRRDHAAFFVRSGTLSCIRRGALRLAPFVRRSDAGPTPMAQRDRYRHSLTRRRQRRRSMGGALYSIEPGSIIGRHLSALDAAI
jgi:hypothetical protein